jgi:hypothetical protein
VNVKGGVACDVSGFDGGVVVVTVSPRVAVGSETTVPGTRLIMTKTDAQDGHGDHGTPAHCGQQQLELL